MTTKNNLIKSKHGWLRIVEAFVAIIMILGVVLTIISRQSSESNKADEMVKLQRQILDYVSRDEALRAQVLSNNKTGVDLLINKTVPSWIATRSLLCVANATICTIELYKEGIQKEVYTDEIILVANLTKSNATKLKLFFWEK